MATGSARGCAAHSCAVAPMAAASPFCRPEEDPFLLLESSLRAVQEMLLRRRGLPLRRSWIEQLYGGGGAHAPGGGNAAGDPAHVAAGGCDRSAAVGSAGAVAGGLRVSGAGAGRAVGARSALAADDRPGTEGCPPAAVNAPAGGAGDRSGAAAPRLVRSYNVFGVSFVCHSY
jgi:hypothetical protein